MPAKTPKFSRTEQAAKSDRLTKWDLIAAIAADAVDAGLPITGAESVVAAKGALEAAGAEYADKTIKDYCVLARFDHESSTSQRKVWRNYGCRTVLCVVSAGWSQEAAADLLRGERKSFRAIEAAVRSASTRAGTSGARSFDARCAEWVQRANKLLTDGAKLAEEAGDDLTAHARFVVLLMERFSETHIDTELRTLLESEAAK